MTELTDLTLTDARDRIARGEVSAQELTEAHVRAVEGARDLNAYIAETSELAMEMAKASDDRRGRGEAGPLEGVPLAIKDLFCTKGVQSTAASHILNGFTPPYESTVTANLWKAGAVMLGKANMDEFAMGSSNENSAHGAARNPWQRRGDNKPLVPGGSSGGSASAVAARAALGATGTDTGGSIRQPASFCGIVGMKPTYGRCSRFGIVAFASSLDQAGPMTRTVRDAAVMLRAMAGHDPNDSTSVDTPVPDFEAALTGDIRGLRVGIPAEYSVEGMPDEISRLWQQGVDWIKAAGAEPVEVSLPRTAYALPAYYIIAPAEASANLARYDGVRFGHRSAEARDLQELYEQTRGEGFGTEVKRRVLIGTYVLSAGYYDAYYNKARKVRTLIAEDFRNAFESVDVLLAPTTPSAAFGVGDLVDDPLSMYLNDVFTVPASLAGLPSISVPAGLSDTGLPMGLQLIGRAFDEETVLRTASVMEDAAGFDHRPAFVAGR
jgi:aspartyl-tRNA(Asn)/glutamyl-tRNA(Gln) amidotransferase subunit A